jgi:hypothetical protein
MEILNKMEIINNAKLRENPYKYSIKILEKNIMNVSLKVLLQTQKLTPDFCVKYILSDDYSFTDSDSFITDSYVLYYQPHITQEDLNQAQIKLDLENDLESD